MPHFIDFRNDENESDLHIKAKDIITCHCVDKSITLINHLNEKLKIEPTDIKVIIQEFSWYIKQKNPRKSFSADVCLIDKDNQILAIIEIVKTHRLTESKYNFYQSLGIFWVELAADYVISEETNFKSSFCYDTFSLNENFNTNEIYMSELDLDQKLTPKQIILNKIIKLNDQLKTTKNSERKLQLKNKKQQLIDEISTPYIKKVRRTKQKNLDKIKNWKNRIKELKIIRKQLKETNQNYSHINEEINKLRKVIKKVEISHLSNRQQRLREKNMNDAKKAKKIRKTILITNSKIVIDIFNQLERISKNTQSNSINYDVLFQIFYTNKKFSNKLSNIQLKQLERLGWTFEDKHFQRLTDCRTVSSYAV